MRQHTETTQKLTKSFDEFGVSLKKIAEVVAAGALTKALIDLNTQFTQLHYLAEQAGTTIDKLITTQFGARQVGAEGDITALILGLRHALLTMPAAAEVLSTLGPSVAAFIDPVTGKFKDTTEAADAVLKALRDLYKEGPIGIQRAQATLQSLGPVIGPQLERVLSQAKELDEYFAAKGRMQEWIAGVGINMQKIGDEAREVTNKWDELLTKIGVVGKALGEPLIVQARDSLGWLLGKLDEIKDKAKAAHEGIASYIADQFSKTDWSQIGRDITKGIEKDLAEGDPFGAAQDKIRDALTAIIKGAFQQAWQDFRNWLRRFPLLPPNPEGPQVPPQYPGTSLLPPNPEGAPQGLPRYQHGGIVPATGPAILHSGEGVVTAAAMSGLAQLGPIMEEMWDAFRNWLFGAGGYRPSVVISNVDELAEAIKGEFYPGGARAAGTAGGGGGGGAGGADGDVGDARGEASPVFANIAEQRKPLMEEIARNPEIKKLLMQMMATEGGGVATVEALFNRVAMIRQKIGNYTIGEELRSGFYGPINQGEAQLRAISAKAAEQYQRIIDHVAAGSNIIEGRVNQGMESDPGAGLPGRIRIPGSSEVYNFWQGSRGNRQFSIEDSMRFAEQETKLANALSSAPLGTTNSYRAGDKTVTLNAQNNFNITGADALSVGGALNSAQSRINADLIRNLTPIVQ
jgi:hypothetical protein